MRQRKILIIHEIRMIRLLLHRYILSELNDATTHEASTVDEALDVIENQAFDAILCSKYMPQVDGIDIFKRVQQSTTNEATPFVVILTDRAESNTMDLLNSGIENYLVSPFNSKTLAAKINALCNPRQWRAENRVHIPDTKAIIQMESQSIETTITNISNTGILCDVKLSGVHTDLMRSAYITIHFSEKFQGQEIRNILCKVLRMNVVSWDEDNSPTHLHVVWCFTGLSDRQHEQIDGILEQAKGENEKVVALDQ